MKIKKNSIIKICMFLAILVLLDSILAQDPVSGASSFSGASVQPFGASDIKTYSDVGGIGSYSGGGSFYGGPANSFSGVPYNYIGGGYAIYGASSNPQFNNPSFFSGTNFVSPEVYWPKFNREDCLERADLIMQIAPGGCSPAVVRSDLLEEQPVPVFCKIMAIQVNPLIEISRIRSITFSGRYPKGVSGVSFYPARAAIRSQQSLISSPVMDNLGYVVIILKRTEKESEMPDFVEGNLTARIDYDMEGAFGIGNTNFYVSEMSDEEWDKDYRQYGFWNGKGYIRADSIEGDRAVISVYRDFNTRQSTVTLQKGQTSRDIYLSGFYCAAGMNIVLERISAPVDSALLRVNDQLIWVSRGDRIMNNRCSVSYLDAYAGGGKISINCPIKNGKIDLSLASGKANLSVEGVSREYMIGEEISNRTYLGYAGQDYKGEIFVVLVKDNYSTSFVEFQDKNVYPVVENVLKSEYRGIDDQKLQDKIKERVMNEYKNKIGRDAERNIQVLVLTTRMSSFEGIALNEVLIAKDRSWDLTKEDEKFAKEYYDLAIKYYEDLISLYPNEKLLINSEEEPYAARGLYEAAQLSRKFGMNEKALDYYDRLVREYPDSGLARTASYEKDLFLRYGESNSRAMVNINDEIFYVELLDFKKPTGDEANAVLLIDGKEEKLGLEEIKAIEGRDGTYRAIQVKNIEDDSVTIGYSKSGIDVKNFYSSTTRSERIKLGEQIDLEGIRIKLVNVGLKKQAKIRVVPKAYGPRTESNFSFKIGIEKRAIKLSPQKTKEMIENFQRTIKEWSDANEKLGKVVSGMKGACFATSALLTVKNLVSGFSGESLARKDVMTKSGGWNEYCEKLVNSGETSPFTGVSYNGLSVQKCLLDHNSQIEKDVSIYKEQIERTNEIIKSIQKRVGVTRSDVFDISGQVDLKKMEEEFAKEFEAFCKEKNGKINLFDKDNSVVNIGKGGVCDWDSLTMDQRREIMTLFNARESLASSGGSSVLKNMIERELGSVTNDAKNYWEYKGAFEKEEEESKKYGLDQRTVIPEGDRITSADIKTITKGDLVKGNVYSKFKEGESVVVVFVPHSESFAGAVFNAHPDVGGKKVVVSVTRQAGGDFVISPDSKVFLAEGGEVSVEAANSVKEYLGKKQLTRFRESNAKAYQNKMLNPKDLFVKYFERAPYKGLPSEVPFDVENGWYVELTYVLSGFGKPYDESGRVLNFWLCNVGPNGLIEFKKSSDDKCIFINSQSGVDYMNFGMSASELNGLIMRAQQAIAEAARQYGRKSVVIGRNTFKSGVSFGGEDGRCSDFMSPSDCNIMFNVCDPVICPSSRCDLGGDFRVDNVVQTGVIGSLMLCLPNYKEGIMMPVCLSGIHAGIEGYLSILNSTVQCLNESLETGRNIGICDEIKSIYLCEFFWKQATPLLNVIIPRTVESLYGQGVRGGGEYSTVQTAWDNMKAAVDYFKNDYAINSMLAFRARSTEEIGGDICKSFMSLNVPNGRNFFDKLIEPDSPVQYTAWFSEDSYTTATLPPTSHYKVYYHIYAGKDQGAYYVIYLKDLPQSNYIYSSQIYVVDRGYISRGSQVDRANDFTAVSGYKQLCISINGKDECGFGKVSSSYAINALSDAYAQEQIKVGIRTEKECVAGTPSLISLINPNLQAGVESVIEPQLYNFGIIRVCASENPGKKVLPSGQYDTTNSTYDRWKDVGYCDDPTIRCWLDTESVKNVVRNKGIVNESLRKVDLNVLGEVDYWTEEQSISVVVQSQREIEGLEISRGMTRGQIENAISPIVNRLDKLTNIGFSNKYRARGFYLLAQLHRKIAEIFVEGITVKEGIVSFVNESKKGEQERVRNDSSSIEWKDDMLKKEVVIKINSQRKEVSYIYKSSKKWVTSDKDFDLNQSYVEGVRKIVGKSDVGSNIVVGGYFIKKGNMSELEVVDKVLERLRQ